MLFQDCNGSGDAFQTVFWHSAAQFDQATAIDVAEGADVTGIDQQLALAGVIRGHVTNVDGDPLSGICVQGVTATAFGGLTGTDDDGNYQLALSATGDYTVQFVDCNDEASRPTPVRPRRHRCTSSRAAPSTASTPCWSKEQRRR